MTPPLQRGDPVCHSQNPETGVWNDRGERRCHVVSWNSAEAGLWDRAPSEDSVRNGDMAADRAWLTTASLCFSPWL